MTRAGRLAVPVLAAAALSLWVVPVVAQEGADSLAVVGHVLEWGTGRPVDGAIVIVDGAEADAATDSTGAFRFEGLSPGVHEFEVSRLGYTTTRRPVEIRQWTSLLLYVTAEPIELERIEVAFDVLEKRRNAIPHTVRVFGPERLAGAASLDLEQFLRLRSGLTFTLCPRSSDRSCVLSRGRPRLLAVYVDESPVLGGMDMVFQYEATELHSVEVIPGCGMVRAYTRRFMERVAAGERWLYPSLPECWF